MKPTGYLPVHLACENGYVDIVLYFLELGINVDIGAGSDNRSLLHIAENEELVSLLLARGLPLAVLDNDNWTPLHYAAHRKNYKVLKALLKAGANIFYKTREGKTALDIANSVKFEEGTLLLTKFENKIATKCEEKSKIQIEKQLIQNKMESQHNEKLSSEFLTNLFQNFSSIFSLESNNFINESSHLL